MEYKIKVENISKTFYISKSRQNLITYISNKLSNNQNHRENTFKLNSINFVVETNDNVAIVGLNGSGKSTLLRIIAGIMQPNSGRIYMNGKAILLSGFGLGMENDLTVEENIYLYGSVYGLDRNMLRGKISEIIEWAELDNFLTAKLRILSSGMRSRLGFSTTKFIDSDIYLFDEALTAGDKKFKQRCYEYFDESIKNGKTFVTCTHDTGFVERFCNKVLWLNKGEQMAFGPTEEVLNKYIDYAK